MIKDISFNDIFSQATILINSINNKFIIEATNDDIFISNSENGFGMRIVKVAHPFLIFYIENCEFEFHLTSFISNSEIICMIKDFLCGKYFYKKNNKEIVDYLHWNNPIFNQFNLSNVNESDINYGYVWDNRFNS
jgi:hypothetical protein